MLSNNTATESTLDVAVGKLTTTDVDNSIHTYSLVSGTGDNDNSKFAIIGDSLFVNGILDNIHKELTESGKIQKVNFNASNNKKK